MGTVGSDAIALVVGHNDQTARLADSIIASVHEHHADTRLETTAFVVIVSRSLKVARDGLVTGYKQVAGLS